MAAGMVEGPGIPAGHRPLQQVPALAELLPVPQRAVLVIEQDDLAVAQPGRPARVVQQHQRQQREHLALVRHESGERPAEPDRLGGEVDAPASPALVEHQVDHGEDRRQPVRQLMIGRHGERNAGVPDLVLRPRQPLAHRPSDGTRNASAISSVDSPPRVRRVSATRTSSASAG